MFKVEETVEDVYKTPQLRTNWRYVEYVRPSENFSREVVENWLAKTKASHLSGDLGKRTRPWTLVNFTSKLDPDQIWIGTEYETGYRTSREYKQIINHLWRSHKLFAVDAEGCGNYPCEITFSPCNLSTFESDKDSMTKLLSYMEKYGIEQSRNEIGGRCACGDVNCEYVDDGEIGIHVNFSTPTQRSNSSSEIVAQVLNNSMSKLSATQKESLFGREPYGWFYAHSEYIEGKLFDTIGTLKEWNVYKERMIRIAYVAEHIASSEQDLTNFSAISNFYEIIRGDDDVENADYVSVKRRFGCNGSYY